MAILLVDVGLALNLWPILVKWEIRGFYPPRRYTDINEMVEFGVTRFSRRGDLEMGEPLMHRAAMQYFSKRFHLYASLWMNCE